MTRDYEGLCERLLTNCEKHVDDATLFISWKTIAQLWDERAEAASAIRELVRQRDEAERETVEKIVAWLREQDGHGYDDMRAAAIEAGEWKE